MLDHRVLLRQALHAGKAGMLLVVPVDHEVVVNITHRHIVLIPLGDQRPTGVQFGTLLVRQRPIRVPGIGIGPAGGIRDRHDGEAVIGLARQGGGPGAVGRQQVLRHPPILLAVGHPCCGGDEAALVLQHLEQRHGIVAHPAQALLVRLAVGVGCRGDAGRRHVQEAEMCRIQVALDDLGPVALKQLLGDEAVRRRDQREFELRQFRQLAARQLCRGGAEIGPDHLAELTHRIGPGAHRLVQVAVRRDVRQFHRFAVAVELPAMIDTAQAAILIAAKKQVRAPVRTAGVEHAELAFGVAERHQFLAHDVHAHRRAIRLIEFFGQRHRQPKPPEILAHRRTGAGLGQQIVLFAGKHGAVPQQLWFSPDYRERRRLGRGKATLQQHNKNPRTRWVRGPGAFAAVVGGPGRPIWRRRYPAFIMLRSTYCRMPPFL